LKKKHRGKEDSPVAHAHNGSPISVLYYCI